ncbi:MAG: valine--tRNA ligase, partial [Candidatus Cloacimonetes bacterium]|nr:valine--tRNA ligase [Candidatus Cloacimonadota bacterium]
VATTRPETMLGDTAVAVHPSDERYSHLIGKTLILPFQEREIPIIADEYVDKKFGSGCVKITPAHDPNDFEIGLNHHLPQVVVIDENGVMNENAGPEFSGLNRFECREKIVALLKEKDLLEEIEKHVHAIGHCYRCNTVVEPYLSEQWFVKMEPLARKAIEVVNNNQIKFSPKRWLKVYLHWMENIRDWCISRQIWWGHRIPVYYCRNCRTMVVAKESPDICQNCGSTDFYQDEDVLDTWFSSWLWPFSVFGWPDNTEELNYFLPTNVLVTAPGIIYLWVARMIMATLEFMGRIPFDTVLLHGMVLDETGRIMSKSLGNSPDPIDIIHNVGADALRFSMIFSTPKGENSYYSDAILETGRNFANKIWNAYRYIMMNADKIPGLPQKHELKLELADHWIYSRLQQVIKAVRKNYENLRFNDAANLLMDFIWKDFCSWYLELSKDRIYDQADQTSQLTTKYILLDVLQNAMRLLHPIMPFLTEEIWQNIRIHFPMPEEALIIAEFPVAEEKMIDRHINSDMTLIQEAISAIRNLRKQVNLPPGMEISCHLNVNVRKQIDLFHKYESYFRKLAKISELIVDVQLAQPVMSIAAVVQDIEIFLPLSGLIDLEKERQKLEKQVEQYDKELQIISSKLHNEKFLTNAPDHIIQKERAKYEEVEMKLSKTKNILKGLE